MLFAASGDTALGHAGSGMLHDVAGRERLASEAPDRKARAELHGEQMRKISEQRAAMANPAYAQSAGDLFEKYTGQRPAQGTPGEMLQMLLANAEKGYQVDESRAGRKDVADAHTLGLREQMQARQDAKAAADEKKNSDNLDKRFTKFSEALNIARGRMGEAGKALGGLQQIESDLSLIEQNPNPTAQQMYEIARGLDRVVSGAAPTIGATEHLMPKTLMGDLNDLKQRFTNSPTGRGQQEFVAQMKDTLERIRANKEKFVGKTLGQSVTGYSDLHGKDKDRFLAQLQSAEIDPSQFDQTTWAYKGAPKAMPKAAGAARPRRTDPATGEVREWDGKAWVAP